MPAFNCISAGRAEILQISCGQFALGVGVRHVGRCQGGAKLAGEWHRTGRGGQQRGSAGPRMARGGSLGICRARARPAGLDLRSGSR